MTEKVSVIIPCFNSEEFIEETIVSVLDQRHPDVELVVVNDGSTDASEKAILRFERHLTYVKTKNLGACHARNYGLKISEGERIVFLDADDFMYPDFISEAIALPVDKDVIPICNVDSFGKGVLNRFWNQQQYQLPFALAFGTPQTAAPLHFRDDLNKVGGFDESLPCAQEYDLHLRLMIMLNKRFVSIDKTGIGIRQRENSLSRSVGIKMQLTVWKILLEIREKYFQSGVYDVEIGHHLIRASQIMFRCGERDYFKRCYGDSMDILNGVIDRDYFEGFEKWLIPVMGIEKYEFFRLVLANLKRAASA